MSMKKYHNDVAAPVTDERGAVARINIMALGGWMDGDDLVIPFNTVPLDVERIAVALDQPGIEEPIRWADRLVEMIQTDAVAQLIARATKVF